MLLFPEKGRWGGESGRILEAAPRLTGPGSSSKFVRETRVHPRTGAPLLSPGSEHREPSTGQAGLRWRPRKPETVLAPGPHSPYIVCGGTPASEAQFSAERPLRSSACGSRDAPAPPAVPLRRCIQALFAVGLAGWGGAGRGEGGGRKGSPGSAPCLDPPDS